MPSSKRRSRPKSLLEELATLNDPTPLADPEENGHLWDTANLVRGQAALAWGLFLFLDCKVSLLSDMATMGISTETLLLVLLTPQPYPAKTRRQQ